MQLINPKNTIDFMGKRRLALGFSAVLLLIAVISIFTRGLELGIDFTGGTLVEVGYSETADLTKIRTSLSEAGFVDAMVQHFGTSKDVLIRMGEKAGESSAQLSTRILQALGADGSHVDLRRIEFVGPQIGDELKEDGGLALLAALFCIMVYVYFRFEARFSLGAVLALVHDVIITLGIFSVFRFEFDLTVLAAVLAVIGYSLNDTIVVYDRVRENFRKVRKGTPEDVINRSVTQTLSRTIMTSLTTLLVLLALFFWGGEIIHGFAEALIIGIAVGTYSSIYVASALVLMLGVTKQDLMPVAKEGADLDSLP